MKYNKDMTEEQRARFLMDFADAFNDPDFPLEELKMVKGFAAVAIFKKENDCSDEEYNAWMKSNEGAKYFQPFPTLGAFRNDVDRYVGEVCTTSGRIGVKVKVLDKEVPLVDFERYWRFLVNARADYIGLDGFEANRVKLHQKLFKKLNLDRLDDRDTKLGRELCRISDMLEKSKDAAFEVEFAKVLKKLKLEDKLVTV